MPAPSARRSGLASRLDGRPMAAARQPQPITVTSSTTRLAAPSMLGTPASRASTSREANAASPVGM